MINKTALSSDMKELAKTQLCSKMTELFKQVEEEADFQPLVTEFAKLYRQKQKGREFRDTFDMVMRVIITTPGRDRDIERFFQYISECIVSLVNSAAALLNGSASVEQDQPELKESMHPLTSHLLQVLPEWSSVSLWLIRARSCQLLHIILDHFQEAGVEEFEEETYEKLARLIYKCTHDRRAEVRVQAVYLAKHLQDPEDDNDPVINRLCSLLQNDPSAKVRQSVLEIIAACPTTNPNIVDRLFHDIDARVRNKALIMISERFRPHSFSTATRYHIVSECIKDPSPLVCKTAEKRLFPVWLKYYSDRISLFIDGFQLKDIRLRDTNFIKGMLTILYRAVTIGQIVEDLELDTTTFLPCAALTPTIAYLYAMFCQIIARDERQRKYLPKLTDFYPYIVKYLTVTDEDGTISGEALSELVKLLIYLEEKSEDSEINPIIVEVYDALENMLISHEVTPDLVLYLKAYASRLDIPVEEKLVSAIHKTYKLYALSAALKITEFSESALKSLSIIHEIFKQDIATTISGMLQEVKEKIILPLCQNQAVSVRKFAVHTLAMYCLKDIHEARALWDIFMKGIKHEKGEVQLEYIKSSFDIIQCFGPEFFSNLEEDYVPLYLKHIDEFVSIVEQDTFDKKLIVMEGILKQLLTHDDVTYEMLPKVLLWILEPNGVRLETAFHQFLAVYAKSEARVTLMKKTFLDVVKIVITSNDDLNEQKKIVNSLISAADNYFRQWKATKEEGELSDMMLMLLVDLTLQDNLSFTELKTLIHPMKLTKNVNNARLKKKFEEMIKEMTRVHEKRAITDYFKKYMLKVEKLEIPVSAFDNLRSPMTEEAPQNVEDPDKKSDQDENVDETLQSDKENVVIEDTDDSEDEIQPTPNGMQMTSIVDAASEENLEIEESDISMDIDNTSTPSR